MAKELSEREQMLKSEAQAFMARAELPEWNQEVHAAFITQRVVAHFPEASQAQIASVGAEMLCMGLGGNCSQFGQKTGLRSAKAERKSGLLQFIQRV